MEFDGPDTGTAIDAIPELEYPLCDEAQIAYLKWARLLLDKGLLTSLSIESVKDLAIAEHDLAKAIRGGKGLRYPREARAMAMRKLTKLYGNSSLPSSPAAANPYAKFGFAKRARQRRHG